MPKTHEYEWEHDGLLHYFDIAAERDAAGVIEGFTVARYVRTEQPKVPVPRTTKTEYPLQWVPVPDGWHRDPGETLCELFRSEADRKEVLEWLDWEGSPDPGGAADHANDRERTVAR